MPITLSPLHRRQFLAASAGALLAAQLRGEDTSAADPHRFLLMADTHIPAAPEIEANGIKMHDHLAQVVASIVEPKSKASAAFILGDLAHLQGKEGDYALLVKLLEPLRKAGLPIHLTLGNHDHRENFWKGLPADDAREKAIEAKHAMIVKAPRANWFILDSLDITNKAPGKVGEAQLAWLAKALDANADKPALIGVHHNPDLREVPGGITDTQPLYDVLLPRKQVKAMFFGHTHVWEIKEKDGLHLVNLPPVAYVFAKGKPNGHLEVALAEDSALLKLTTLAKDHPEQGKEIVLKWRT